MNFLVLLFKILRWMSAVTGPKHHFHPKPDVRTSTPNNHHVTWVKDGLFKEFRVVVMDRMAQVYAQVPPLKHVEHGRVLLRNPGQVMITRLGNQLTLGNMLRAGLTKQDVLKQVTAGLEELHSMGLAHCDLSINNVFIDDDGVVFLEDLEYLTPLQDVPPHLTRLPYGTDHATVRTALDLDNHQLQSFEIELNRM